MNFKRTAALVATTSLVFGLTGCGNTFGSQVGLNANNGNFGALARAKREKGGSWNVLVHLAAENNLYRFGLEDLNEMEAGMPEGATDVNVFVLFDGIKNGDSAIYKIKRDPAGKNGTIVSEIVNDGGAVIPANKEIDSGDVKTAAKFLDFIAKKFPADHVYYGQWDHGSGIFGKPQAAITKGFGWDDNGSHMSTKDMNTLSGAYKSVSGKNIDIFGFDACLMAHGELAYQVAGSVDFLAASEELEPGPGYDYAGFLSGLGKLAAGQRTPSAVGSVLVDSYVNSYKPGGSQASGDDEVTYSLTDVNAVAGNFVPALNKFVAVATKNMAANKAAFQAARAKTQVFYNKDCADIGHFLSLLSGVDAETKAAADAALAAYKTTIVRENHSHHFPGASGFVLYFPKPTDRYSAQYDDASQIAFGGKTDWKNFLKAYK